MYLENLLKRGLTTFDVGGRIALTPKKLITDRIRTVVSQHSAEILDELRAHQARMIAQAEELERRILSLLDACRITQEDAEERLTYLFRLTATTPAPAPPCQCGEVLLWCFPEEALVAFAPDKKLPLLCHKCHPPKSGQARYFLADEDLQPALDDPMPAQAEESTPERALF